MNITVVNGIRNTADNPLQTCLRDIIENVDAQHNVDLFTIEDMDINYCRGCFSCWVKNPGRCIYRDDIDEVLKSIVKADLFLIVSPLDAGFITSEAKKALDRIIPLVLPFIKGYGGECHHVPRYERNADLGILLLDEGSGIEDEAKDIVFESFDRLAKNFHANKVIKTSANAQNLSEVMKNEIICG